MSENLKKQYSAIKISSLGEINVMTQGNGGYLCDGNSTLTQRPGGASNGNRCD
ncbi:hypothetical protein [Calothrix sp. PCC 6303]|uniref:hypothetical protein n=1 Tax=Calothrix sp. PCC 6303 TaxID=1170562 RepID=UPI0002A04DFF|nr:hypothetical protein [Calothrix sp. PCC 6303]AFY99917.1 hypothetical protein Cal6303_0852 [Calothrix sp. PCC 6303]